MKYCLFITANYDSNGGFLKQSINIKHPNAHISTLLLIFVPEFN